MKEITIRSRYYDWRDETKHTIKGEPGKQILVTKKSTGRTRVQILSKREGSSYALTKGETIIEVKYLEL